MSPRADFWNNPENVTEFKGRFGDIKDKSEYLDLKEWYLKEAGPESKGNEKKDHMPFVLEQMSYEPKDLPTIILKDVPLFEAIELPANEVFELHGYEPHRWKSKAVMAA